jgi:hypothetical protein
MTTSPCFSFASRRCDVGWPTPQDYNEAVQNPQYSFSDRELQGGSCEVTALGLPKPITGNFASVYRLRCNGRDWAVRCFWRELADMQQRYAAISAHLVAARLPYTVGFEYQPQGIRVRGNWYPILKMEWVEGELLHDYLASHLHDSASLHALTERWLRLASDLEQAGCAHGDLQHGNVLVVNGELKLVDYDGMFVPALVGMGSHELGHQHYQHPGRGASDFDSRLDRFSAWVIYVSISALQADPGLWAATQAGDERLLLRRQDFENPGSSTSLSLLTSHSDSELQALAARFRTLLGEPLPALPALSASLGTSDLPGEMGENTATGLHARLGLLWQSLAPSVQHHAASEPSSATSYPEWMLDYLPASDEQPLPPAGRHAGTARAAMVGVLPITGIALITFLGLGVPVLVATILLVLILTFLGTATCIVAYRQEPAVRRILPVVRRESYARRRIAACGREAQAVAAKKEANLRRTAQDQEEAAERRSELQDQEKVKVDGLRENLTARLEAIDRQIYEVDQQESEEASLRLEELQKRHIGESLRRASLRTASIPGVGSTVKMRLWTLGVWAAADVTSERIRSMQHLKHEHLMGLVSWRVGTETGARRTMPRQLPLELKGELHRRYARERVRLVAKRSEEEAAAHQAMEEVQESFGQRRAQLDGRLTEMLQQRAEITARLEDELLRVTVEEQEHRRSLQAAREEMARATGVSFRQFLLSIFVPWIREEWY